MIDYKTRGHQSSSRAQLRVVCLLSSMQSQRRIVAMATEYRVQFVIYTRYFVSNLLYCVDSLCANPVHFDTAVEFSTHSITLQLYRLL